MSTAVFKVNFAGPHVAIQDGGRSGLMRFGVPRSGPMDRSSFAAANVAVGNLAEERCIEISMGGLVLDCVEGEATFSMAGGGFLLECGGESTGSWSVRTVKTGDRLAVRPGRWGSWTYLAFAGRIRSSTWLGSASTHSMSGFGGGKLANGQIIQVDTRGVGSRIGTIPFPVFARPRSELRVILGPQDRFFSAATLRDFLTTSFRLSDAYDRMGARLQGASLAPATALDIPSEPIVRGSVQVSGDGVPTVLLADHQTTGGYPKIATVIDADLDGFTQLRPGDYLGFVEVDPATAVRAARLKAKTVARYLEALARGI